MTKVDRRNFLKAAAAVASLPLALREALAIPADRRTGSIKDVEHVVILMQENRSFDHYFGSLRGVRGFGDPRALTLPSGQSVFHQPVAPGVSDVVMPFHFNAETTNAERLGTLDHSWKAQHSLWKNHDAWIPVKTPMTMGYFKRDDIPFYYALADAFTICDAYHCSVFGPTGPNRLFLFSGTSGLGAKNSGPQVVENIDDGNWTADAGRDNASFPGFTWTTYSDRLQKAGISWKVYQEYDNFGDNPLACFPQFRALDPQSEMYRRGRAWVDGSTAENAENSYGDKLIAAFAQDVARDALPQVSWIVAPTAACEHPDAPPTIGEAFTAGMLAALAAHPKIWAKTVFILNYDENDGFFDHMPPPLPATLPALGASTVATEGEAYGGVPFGLGPRVPAIIVSPWTRGGWVNSELFDHTSVIRFLEARFGVMEPNITPWRRAVTGDLTSVFDFAKSDDKQVALPAIDGSIARLQAAAAKPQPIIPAIQAMPEQESGIRPARPLPYRLAVTAAIGSTADLTFENRGTAGACFHVVAAGPAQPGPWFFTVEAGKSLQGSVAGPRAADGIYDLTIFGPNGFFRHLRGAGPSAIEVDLQTGPSPDEVTLRLRNSGPDPVELEVQANGYGDRAPRRYSLAGGEQRDDRRAIAASGHWYDFSVSCAAQPLYLRRLAGHVETGAPSISDPAIGRDLRSL